MVESRIPDDRTSISAFEPVEDNIYEQGRNLLEDEQSEGDFDSYQVRQVLLKPKSHQKALTKNFYFLACKESLQGLHK